MKIISIELDENNKIKSLYHKGDTALREGMPIFLSDELEGLAFDVAFAIKTNRVGKYISKKFARRYYNEYAYALDLSLIDRADLPEGSISFSFDNSSAFSSWIDVSKDLDLPLLYKNEELVYNYSDSHLLKNINVFDLFDDILVYFSKYYTIKIGDIFILKLHKNNSDKLKIGDRLELKTSFHSLLSLDIK